MGKKTEKGCKGGDECQDEQHLCKVAGRKDIELVRKMVRNARYFCRKCGRAAKRESNVCRPEEI